MSEDLGPSSVEFDENLRAAKGRLLRFAQLATEELDAEKLNLLSFHCAIYMNAFSGSPRRLRQFEDEIAAEQGGREGSPGSPEITD